MEATATTKKAMDIFNVKALNWLQLLNLIQM